MPKVIIQVNDPVDEEPITHNLDLDSMVKECDLGGYWIMNKFQGLSISISLIFYHKFSLNLGIYNSILCFANMSPPSTLHFTIILILFLNK